MCVCVYRVTAVGEIRALTGSLAHYDTGETHWRREGGSLSLSRSHRGHFLVCGGAGWEGYVTGSHTIAQYWESSKHVSQEDLPEQTSIETYAPVLPPALVCPARPTDGPTQFTHTHTNMCAEAYTHKQHTLTHLHTHTHTYQPATARAHPI